MRNLGGNMKTHLAVYEDGLFDLRGGGAKQGHFHSTKLLLLVVLFRAHFLKVQSLDYLT